MLCKDCYHYDACTRKNGSTPHHMGMYVEKNIEKVCKLFKDKSTVLELPCKVGNAIFLVENNEIKELYVETIHCWRSGAWKINAHTDKRFSRWKAYELRFEAFGKTVFLTHEEAEAALKAMEVAG